MEQSPTEFSASEARFDVMRRRAGFLLAPALFLAVWLLPISGLEEPAHRLLAVIAAVVTLWVTEALPLPVTALLGPALCVLTGAYVPDSTKPAVQVFRSFADPVIFLFIGSFLLAEAMLHHGLNRRIAFQILALPGVGRSPTRLLAAFGVITAIISMWVSNTATTAMMFPIGMAILHEMARHQSERTGRDVPVGRMKFATGLMLLTAFAASVGGLGTPVGTPPNLIGIGLIERSLGIRITFFQWMSFGVPLLLVLVTFLILYLGRACPAEPGLMHDSAEWLRQEKARLGPVRRGEWNVMAAFALTVMLWLVPGVIALMLGSDDALAKWFDRHLPEAVAALIGALLLFLLPVRLDQWEFVGSPGTELEFAL